MEERSKEERKVLYGKSHRFHPVIPFTVDSAPWRPLFLTSTPYPLAVGSRQALSTVGRRSLRSEVRRSRDIILKLPDRCPTPACRLTRFASKQTGHGRLSPDRTGSGPRFETL
jgi:hypothetical protein